MKSLPVDLVLDDDDCAIEPGAPGLLRREIQRVSTNLRSFEDEDRFAEDEDEDEEVPVQS